MAKPGPARKPRLQVVREGNPDHRAADELEPGLTFPPGAPDEPGWQAWFPLPAGLRAPRRRKAETDVQWAGRRDAYAQAKADRDQLRQAVAAASAEWRRIVPVLDAEGLLAEVDATVLSDHCVVVARIGHCEREISRLGIAVPTERGYARNPAITAANQYRTALRHYLGQLGLTPLARDALSPTGGGDGPTVGPWD